MFEHLIHVNSKGESLDFYELGIFQNYNDLRDYEWEYSEVGNRIKNFRKKPVQKTVPYIFIVDEEKAVEIVNKFHEHFDIDIVRKTKGYFKIGEWRLYCYCEGMNFDDYLKLNGYLKITCKYISDEPNWRKEQKASFKPQEQGDYDFLDFFGGKRKRSKNLLDDSKKHRDGTSIFFGGATSQTTKSVTLPAGTYTYSVGTSDGTGVHMYVNNIDTNVRVATAYTSFKVTFTIDEPTNLSVWVYHSRITSLDIITYAQIEKGTEATDYEPYSNASGAIETDTETKIYGGDYPFDFTGRTAGRASFVVDHFADCDFKMTIYGPAIYPRVLIEDTVYQVYTTLATNEYLVVDSKNKQVIKYSVNGTATNCFDLRNKTNSIFTKISGGSHSAIWDGSFGFDITFYIERSTPTWNLF